MVSMDDCQANWSFFNCSEFSKDCKNSDYDWDNSGGLLSDSARTIFIIVNHVIIDMFICVFGIVGNCINITVFLKQGLRKSVNLSLFAMSTSDLVGLIFQVWQNFCLNPYLEEADLPIQFVEVQILTGGSPSVVMVRITGWITAYITAERCLSVLIPLHIRRLVTFRRTACILIFLYGINIAFFLPKGYASYISWNFYPSLNKSKLGLSFRDNEPEITWLLNMSHFYLSTIAFILVVIFTTVLVIALRKTSRRRKGITSSRDQRESRTIALIVMVATVLIVCYAPGVTCAIVEPLFSDFNIGARQENMYRVVWSFCFMFHSINASINILVYYTMSSQYRTTLCEIFPILKNRNNSGNDKPSRAPLRLRPRQVYGNRSDGGPKSTKTNI